MPQATDVYEQPRTGSSGCHLVFHPLDDLLLAPDDRPTTKLDLLGGGDPVPHAVIDEGLAHTRHLKYLYKAQETGLSSVPGWHDRQERKGES